MHSPHTPQSYSRRIWRYQTITGTPLISGQLIAVKTIVKRWDNIGTLGTQLHTTSCMALPTNLNSSPTDKHTATVLGGICMSSVFFDTERRVSVQGEPGHNRERKVSQHLLRTEAMGDWAGLSTDKECLLNGQIQAATHERH